MPSERAPPRRRALPTLGVALCGLASASCLFIPTPEHGLAAGRGAIGADVLHRLAEEHATRADVLLRFGEPDERREGDDVFVYSWGVYHGEIGVVGGPSWKVPRWRFAAIRFGAGGAVADAALLASTTWALPSNELERWVRSGGTSAGAGGPGP